MSDLKQARSLFGMALKDLKALRGMMDREVFEDEIFGFHVQQSVEKSLKAWMAFLGLEYPHVHDTSVLLESLRRTAVDAEDYWDLVEYNAFAVQFRYEAVHGSDTAIDREEAIRRVEALVHHIQSLLGNLEEA